MNARTSLKNRGFTLVELLVVITIIGVLAALATGGAMYARIMVIQSLTKVQLTQMDTALESYKNTYNEYPPLLSDKTAVERHATSRWKKASLTYAAILAAAGLPANATEDQMIAASLTFWLGGLRDPVSGEYTGFCADVANPLKTGLQRTSTEFDFSEKNTLPIAGTTAFCFAVYDKPVVYFRSTTLSNAFSYMRKVENADEYHPLVCDMGEFGVAAPYAKTFTGDLSSLVWTREGIEQSGISWYAAKKYQLIHPGRDALFADPDSRYKTGDGCQETWFACVETGDGITYADNDNIVNFTETSTLEGAMNQ